MVISRRSLLKYGALCSIFGAICVGCDKTRGKKIDINIDWVPSPEYYGIFLAKSYELYNSGFAANVTYGTGAPTVAAQLAAGTVLIGTTTSDNVARQIQRGASFSAAVPLLRFNPSSFGSFESSISSVKGIVGKTLGVNKNSVTYQQLLFLLSKNDVLASSFHEFPIGFGGVPELLNGTIDVLTGYSTNQMVDADMERQPFFETTFDSLGVHSYGLVLVFARKEALLSGGIEETDILRIAQCIVNGYIRGAAIPMDAVERLIEEEPALGAHRKRLLRAISKIAGRSAAASKEVAPTLDDWLSSEGVSENAIVSSRDLMEKGLRDVS